MHRRSESLLILIALATAGALILSTTARAHCDTLDGPVVADARRALAARDVTPVLKWVTPEDEPAIRESFAQASAVRTLGSAAQELADRHFFETLVRLHRAGEGAPFTGLAPAGAPVEPIILAADQALASGTEAALVEHLTHAVAQGARRRFALAAEARGRAEDSVESGRRYVAHYVELTHWLERLERDATTDAARAGAAASATHEH